MLKSKYASHSALCNKFDEIDDIKNRIRTIENEICEGIKIRARVDEKINGEKASLYLLGREKNAKSIIAKLETENGTYITDSKAIEYQIVDFYENLYSKEEGDCRMQESFLDMLESTIGEDENKMLTAEVTVMEIWKAISSMKNGKCPGIDGLSIEFYKSEWEIIKHEFVLVVKDMFKDFLMCKDMNKGVIKLAPKSGNLHSMNNWRPITMMNVDYKIVAKIITNRIKSLLPLFISKEQFCAVPSKSISQCNNVIRDIMYYLNYEKVPAAMINLDWSKAFDRVNLDFLFKVLQKLGFAAEFVSLIKMLYTGARSVICINGNLSKDFPIKKSVRQGCPLSMTLFIIVQEPLYRMLKSRIASFAPTLPNNLTVTVLGYADDSTVVVNSDEGIQESLHVVKGYELATGAKLNLEKTSIIGIGLWRNRTNWPVNGLKALTGRCEILGIVHCNDYNEAGYHNWGEVETKIVKCIGQMSSRKLTIFQKALIINCKILSRAWYVSHTYPLPSNVGKRIEKHVFRYLWNGNYQPINRQTMYLPRDRGGCGVINVNMKSKSIFFATFYKCIVNKVIGFELSVYYCQLRISYLISFDTLYETTVICSSYYNELISLLRIVIKMKDYPCLKSKNIYWFLLQIKDLKPNIESSYPLFDWNNIWKNVNSKFIDPHDRQIIFKYIHEVLATKDRLFMMNMTNSNACAYCGGIENVMHLIYFCPMNKNVIDWITKLLKRICNIKTKEFLKVLKFDFVTSSNKDRNSALILLCDYLVGVWHASKIGLLTDDRNLICFIRNRMHRTRWMLLKTFKNKSYDLFTNNYLNQLLILR